MKYFRTYPWGLQFLLFLLMVFTLLSGTSVIIGTLLPKLTGIMPTQMEGIGPNSPAYLVSVTLVVEGLINLCVFLLPAFLFSYLTHPKPLDYLGLRAPGKWIQPFLVIGVMLGAMPVLEMLSGLIGHIDFGPKVKASQQANEDMMATFLNMPTLASFVKVFLIMAIVPAMGEEMFFRGVLMRFTRKQTTSMVIPVVFTALVFAFVHSNVYGFISIFLAGVLLAVIYNLTGSLWCSILAHLFFNGFQIILSYASNSNPGLKAYMENANVPTYLVIGGAVLFSISFYLLLKNKTPLPLDWTNDFKDLAPVLSETENKTEQNL